MKDRIKFSDEMLAAVIDGRKTQTRRLIEPQPVLNGNFYEVFGTGWSKGIKRVTVAPGHSLERNFPYGQVGDTIPFADKDGNIKGEIEIVDIWLQRVQEISQEDTLAEGFSGDGISGSAAAYAQFADIWISIYGAESWSENPWVWVIEFKQVQG
ncbi:ASCH domain-containing protein [Morganella morganii]|uniref:ASCH domain-containing protein n=1 Tax=Morganella morganii TaxID=582 RepID=UPI0034E3BC26